MTSPYARFTRRINHTLERIGLAPAGRVGSRPAAQLGFDAGRTTLLCRVVALPDPQSSTPRVLGADDFATRRGQSSDDPAAVTLCDRSPRSVPEPATRNCPHCDKPVTIVALLATPEAARPTIPATSPDVIPMRRS